MNTTRSAGFEPVHAVASLLSGLTVPWWITGGWAIDLAVGHVTRDHADVDVMMLERDEHALRGLTGVDIQLMADDQPPGLWPAGRRLTAWLPVPDRRVGDRLILHGENLPLPAEVIPASAVGAVWVYRHGARIFTRPLADMIRYWQGIPFLAPEVVLLIKARPGTDRPGTDNDQRDFEAACRCSAPVSARGSKTQSNDHRGSKREPNRERGKRTGERGDRTPPRPPRQHRWTAELATDPHRPA